MAPPPNLTGFDKKKFIESAGQAVNDPWARREAWRYTGPFTRRARFSGLFPGFGLGAGLFVVYLGYEALFLKKDKAHGHDAGDAVVTGH
jgi:NADH dehydrogenase (ubiquinone) 1 beta subcomplex subunit 3